MIDSCGQFHQHISSFCTNILTPKKLYSQTEIREKLCKALLCEKGERKMKLTPGVLCFFNMNDLFERTFTMSSMFSELVEMWI